MVDGAMAVACVLGTYKSLRRDIAFANRMGEWAYSRMNGQNFNAEFQRVCSGEGVCFVAGTAIVIRDEALLPMVSQTEVGPVPENASLWSVLGLTCIVAGLAPLVVGRRRESDAERRRAQELLFAEPDEFDPFGPESEPQNDALSPLLPEEFNALCDRLFAEEESDWDASGDEAAHLAGNVAASAVSDWPTMRTAAVPFRHDGRQVALLDEPRALPHRAAPSKRAISQRTPSAARPMSLVRRWTGGWVLLCALLAGCCFWMATGGESQSGGLNPEAAIAVSAPGPQTQPIESVRVGQRVIARNPEVADAERSRETAVNPATWRKLRLVAENRWEDGTDDPVEVETLQPPEWVAEHKAQVGVLVPIPLDLVEIGLPEGLRARVVANDPCPAIEPGPGNVVLTTVNHLNRDVWELTLTDGHGRSEQFRPTGFHKFYSQSRGEWVSTQDLGMGEVLGALHRPLTVTVLHRVPGVHRVYNMTVAGEHVYHVSSLAVVAHNMNCSPNEQPRDAFGRWGPKEGGEVSPGSIAEFEAWDAIAGKPGWTVTRGRIYVVDSTGQVRVYDGYATSPSGRNIGLEVKSGTARRTADQRAFDTRLNSNRFNSATGTGKHEGVRIQRSIQIRR